jgi:tetratricopeptide (TPR) repeat protein
MSQYHPYKNEQVSALNHEGITLFHLGDFDGALIRIHRALLLSAYHSVRDQSENENISSSSDVIDDSNYSLLSERPTSGVDLERDGENEIIQSSSASNKNGYSDGISNQQIGFDEGMCQFKDPIHIPTDEDDVDQEVVKACLMYNIAILHSQINEEEEAELYFAKVLSIITVRRSILELHASYCASNTTSFQGPTSSAVLHNIGYVQFQSSRFEDAVRTYRKVLRNAIPLCTSYQVSNCEYFHLDLSSTLNCLGVALFYMAIDQPSVQREECLEKADNALTQALVVRENIIEHDVHKLERATIINNLGRVKFLSDSLNEALRLYEEAYHIRSSFLEEIHVDVAAVLYNMGQVHLRLGNNQKTLSHYHDCLGIITTKIGNGHPKVIHLLLEIGGIYMEKQRFNLAMGYYTQAFSEWCTKGSYNKEEIQEHPDILTSCIQKKLNECNCKCKKRHNFIQHFNKPSVCSESSWRKSPKATLNEMNNLKKSKQDKAKIRCNSRIGEQAPSEE